MVEQAGRRRAPRRRRRAPAPERPAPTPARRASSSPPRRGRRGRTCSRGAPRAARSPGCRSPPSAAARAPVSPAAIRRKARLDFDGHASGSFRYRLGAGSSSSTDGTRSGWARRRKCMAEARDPDAAARGKKPALLPACRSRPRRACRHWLCTWTFASSAERRARPRSTAEPQEQLGVAGTPVAERVVHQPCGKSRSVAASAMWPRAAAPVVAAERRPARDAAQPMPAAPLHQALAKCRPSRAITSRAGAQVVPVLLGLVEVRALVGEGAAPGIDVIGPVAVAAPSRISAHPMPAAPWENPVRLATAPRAGRAAASSASVAVPVGRSQQQPRAPVGVVARPLRRSPRRGRAAPG